MCQYSDVLFVILAQQGTNILLEEICPSFLIIKLSSMELNKVYRTVLHYRITISVLCQKRPLSISLNAMVAHVGNVDTLCVVNKLCASLIDVAALCLY